MGSNIEIMLLLFWGIFTLSFLFMPLAFASGPAQASDQIYEECHVIYLNEFWYRQARVNIEHEPASSTIQRFYDDETIQQITLEEPLVPEGESTFIGFHTNSTGHMVAKLILEHNFEKTEPREIQINYQSAGQDATRTNLDYTSETHCIVFDMFVREAPHIPTPEETIALAGEITNERFKQNADKVGELSILVIRAIQISGIMSGVVAFIGIMIWLGRKQSVKAMKDAEADYKLMRQEYGNMIQDSAVEQMHNALDVANIKKTLRDAVQYFDIAVQKHLDNLSFIASKGPSKPEETVEEKVEEKPISKEAIKQKIEGIKTVIKDTFQNDPTNAGEEFKKELLDKIKDKEEPELHQFLQQTYIEMYPKTAEGIEHISPELSERLYIVKHLMGKKKSEYMQ